MRDGFARDSLHRQLVSALAVSPDVSLKTPVFPGFSAQFCRRRLSPRGRDAGIAAVVSVRRFCGSVSLLTGKLTGILANFPVLWAKRTFI